MPMDCVSVNTISDSSLTTNNIWKWSYDAADIILTDEYKYTCLNSCFFLCSPILLCANQGSTLNYQKKCQSPTSFPGSLILPPHSSKMRDPGNEVEMSQAWKAHFSEAKFKSPNASFISVIILFSHLQLHFMICTMYFVFIVKTESQNSKTKATI